MTFARGTVVPAVVDGGTWAACFGLSWADMLLHDQAGNQCIIRPGGQYLRKVAGTMGVAAGRNEIAAAFLAGDADWLFMVDSDMGFAADTVERLIDSATLHNRYVMGALCFAQKEDPDLREAPFYGKRFRIQPTIYRYAEVASTGERGFQAVGKYRRDAVQDVSGTGAACILIHRAVLGQLGADPFSPITDPKAGGNGTARTFSEDLSFCIRVQGLGMSLSVDTAVKTTHYKGGIFLDETAYAMQQETLIQAKGREIAIKARLAMGSVR